MTSSCEFSSSKTVQIDLCEKLNDDSDNTKSFVTQNISATEINIEMIPTELVRKIDCADDIELEELEISEQKEILYPPSPDKVSITGSQKERRSQFAEEQRRLWQFSSSFDNLDEEHLRPWKFQTINSEEDDSAGYESENETISSINESKESVELSPSEVSEIFNRKLNEIKLTKVQNIAITLSSFWMHHYYIIMFIREIKNFAIWGWKISKEIEQITEYSDQTPYLVIAYIQLLLPTAMAMIFLILATLETSGPKDINYRKIIAQVIYGLFLVLWSVKMYLERIYRSIQRFSDIKHKDEEELNDGDETHGEKHFLAFFQNLFSGFLGVCLQVYIFLADKKWTEETVDTPEVIYGALMSSFVSLWDIAEQVTQADEETIKKWLPKLGWLIMFANRAAVFVLAATVIRYWILFPIIFHVIGFSIWIYRLSLQSFNDNQDEILDEARGAQLDWRVREKVGRYLLFAGSLFIFGIPSLVYWPIMLTLKESGRPYIYFAIIFFENSTLLMIWNIGVLVNNITTITPSDRCAVNLAIFFFTSFSIFLIIKHFFSTQYRKDEEVVVEIWREKRVNQTPIEVISIEHGLYWRLYHIVFPLPTVERCYRNLASFYDNSEIVCPQILDNRSCFAQGRPYNFGESIELE